MKKNLHLTNITKTLHDHIPAVLWVLLGLVLALEAYVLQNSASILLSAQSPFSKQTESKVVRINFKAYDQVATMIEQGSTYDSPISDLPDPFSVKVVEGAK